MVKLRMTGKLGFTEFVQASTTVFMPLVGRMLNPN